MQNLNLDVFNAFNKGWALVTAGSLSDYNTMTVSWGQVGTVWNKSVATVYIKPIRHTFSYMEKNDTYTISFFPETYRKDLMTLGTLSGKDTDKVAKTSLTPVDLGGCVGFAQASCTLVCKKLYAEDLNVEKIPDVFVQKYYTEEAAHRMYIGEVTEVIQTPVSAE